MLHLDARVMLLSANVMDDRERLLEMLVRYSYREESEPVFRLASGKLSNVYVNCKLTTMRRDAAPLIAHLFARHVPAQAQAAGGLTAGADPIAYAMRDFCTDPPLHAFMVRKDVKDHGTRLGIEGPLEAGMNVVVVDDVATTGGSTIVAIQRCRAAGIGLRVVAVIVLVDRQEGGLQAIEREVGADVPVSAIFTKQELQARWALQRRADESAGARPSAS